MMQSFALASHLSNGYKTLSGYWVRLSIINFPLPAQIIQNTLVGRKMLVHWIICGSTCSCVTETAAIIHRIWQSYYKDAYFWLNTAHNVWVVTFPKTTTIQKSLSDSHRASLWSKCTRPSVTVSHIHVYQDALRFRRLCSITSTLTAPYYREQKIVDNWIQLMHTWLILKKK